MVGFGSIGQGVLPLLMRHLDIEAHKVRVIAADQRGRAETEQFGVGRLRRALTPQNYRTVLDREVRPGDFLLNLSVDVSSAALIEVCQARGALYLDTCTEPWRGGYRDAALTPAQRTNYALREHMLTLKARYRDGPTAVVTHGANPGLVSHLLKRALLELARDANVDTTVPQTRAGWAALAAALGVKAIHIAERDTQVSRIPKRRGEFVNTWSIDGFVSEGCQPAELGWGSHERHCPADARRHASGSGCAIWLERPGAATRVRSWTPGEGAYHGFLITHAEAISIADYFTLYDNGGASYRPTVHYAYHPCDAAVLSLHELAGKNWHPQPRQRLLMDDITGGMDELGVLLLGHRRNAFWYGSQLSVDEARALAPYNNATTLQVAAAVLSGMVWALDNPRRGVVEPDEMDFARNLEICAPYLGTVCGVYSDWTPLQHRGELFGEDTDSADPWQFKNIRVG